MIRKLTSHRPVVLNLGSRLLWRWFAIFLGVARASDKNILITSRFYISYIEPLFSAAKMIGSPRKNDSLVSH